MDSIDFSRNEVTVSSNQLFRDLQEAISTLVDDENKRKELVKLAEDMANSEGTPGFLENYKAFIASTADHMTLFLPFIPTLTQLLPTLLK